MRCSLCPQTHRQVFASGPRTATIMLVAEGPGRWEDSEGIPFVGRAGQELDHTYLPLAGLQRSAIYVTNCVQCRCERNGVDVKPGEALVKACAANHLYDEIHEVDPKVIILCGATACSLVPGIDLELDHGFPQQNTKDFGFWAGTIVPMYHPAAGLHETRFMTPLLEDWERLGKWLRGEWKGPNEGRHDGTKPGTKKESLDYRLVESESDLRRELTPTSGTSLSAQLACDCETDEGAPYSVQFSPRPGVGRFIKADRQDLVRMVCEYAESRGGFIFHNAPFDIDVIERAGGWVDAYKVRDTQQELYHLGNQPQGLKAAVYRIFGHRMTSYEEVVTPYSKQVLEDWLARALAYVSSEMRERISHPVGKDCPTCGKSHRLDVSIDKPHEAEAVLRRVLGKLDSDYDPWEKPKRAKGEEKPRLIGREWLGEIEEKVGRMPRKSIVHAPLSQQIKYAVGDSDWTGRLATWLEKERARIVREEWCVA